MLRLRPMLYWAPYAAAYAFLAAFSAGLFVWLRGSSPLVHPSPWQAGPPDHVGSLLLGLLIGAALVVGTRLAVPRFEWARRLHLDLRWFARPLDLLGITVIAVTSAFGEELFFRSLLGCWVGLVPQALLFGLLHQVPGPSRWIWVLWAVLVGLALGAVFQLTGSLAGPLLAHALINGMNLDFLRRHDPNPDARSLGGILGHRG